LALHQQQLDTATELLKQSLAIQRTVSDAAGIAMNLEDLAHVTHARGNPRLMAQLLASADALRQSNGISLNARELERFDGAVASARGALDDATFRSAWAMGAGSPPEDVLRLVDTA
jgi:hypothetical protein